MSSDRNRRNAGENAGFSLVDWDMSSDRNRRAIDRQGRASLVDWDMSSDRNPTPIRPHHAIKSSRLGYEL